MSIKLSLVELGAVDYGQTRSDAIKDVVTTAQKVEEWGCHRIWLAEHHNTANMVSPAPEVIIPFVASNTSHIRVGSGSVLLNHYSPFKVAEVFTLLGDMFPGRIAYTAASLGLNYSFAGFINPSSIPHWHAGHHSKGFNRNSCCF